jgi:hypothetical protein
MTAFDPFAHIADIDLADLPGNTEIKPPLTPDGWTGILYPTTDRLQLGVWLDPVGRRVHIAATHRPWTLQQVAEITRILTTAYRWLAQLEQPPP